jgi:Arc/MetJ-type ribon-helix-helix transcriptional regulator
MSTQITVRLPDDLVEYIDRLVASGRDPSRAATVARALERERRREIAENDARIYAKAAAATELDDLAEWATRHAPAID